MIIEDNFFPDPKEHPSKVTAAELCERFAAAGLPCASECLKNQVRITFKDRKSNLIFLVDASGHLLSAEMGDESDYNADLASILFEVFESIGWTYAPGLDKDGTDLLDAGAE